MLIFLLVIHLKVRLFLNNHIEYRVSFSLSICFITSVFLNTHTHTHTVTSGRYRWVVGGMGCTVEREVASASQPSLIHSVWVCPVTLGLWVWWMRHICPPEPPRLRLWDPPHPLTHPPPLPTGSNSKRSTTPTHNHTLDTHKHSLCRGKTFGLA